MTKRTEIKPRIRRAPASVKHPAAVMAHPHSVPTVMPAPETDQLPDQPFVEGAHDVIDSDLRHRMISETAYRMYTERGYVDGFDVDDWLQAEAEVDHLLLNPPLG